MEKKQTKTKQKQNKNKTNIFSEEREDNFFKEKIVGTI